MSAPQPYTHAKFEKGETNVIRLLRIDSGDPQDRIRCSLFNAKFDDELGCVASSLSPQDDQPPQKSYDAVSWAWGEQERDAEIEIRDDQGKRWTFGVPQKLEAGLKALRHSTEARVVWIDFICINQTDVYEKSHQVPLMDKIYSLADSVCVWLGPDSEDAGQVERAFKLVDWLLEDMDYEKTIDNLEAAKFAADHLKALSSLMRRDWFSRRWVIQEVALAKKATIFCGNQKMDWNKFARAIELFVMGENKTRRADHAMMRDEYHTQYWSNVSGLGAARLVEVTSKLFRQPVRAEGKPEPLMSLEQTVCQLESFQTSKSHDTIYAYLAIAKDAVPVAHYDTADEDIKPSIEKRVAKSLQEKQLAKRFFVDYKKPYGEVCRQFVEFAIQQNPDRQTALNVLCRPWAYEADDVTNPAHDPSLPNWATSLASARFEMNNNLKDGVGLYRRNGDPLVGVPSPGHYKAAGERIVNEKVLRFLTSYVPDTNKEAGEGEQKRKTIHSLIVSGFVLDEIEIVKDKILTTALIPEEWLWLGGWNKNVIEPPDEFWRTLVADRGPNGTNCPLFYPAACSKALSMSQSVRNLEINTIITHREHYKSAVADFCRRVEEVVVNRKLIKTKREKCLGLVSGRAKSRYSHTHGTNDTNDNNDTTSIRQGDLICILHGCSVPVVLRKVKKPAAELDQVEQWAGRTITRWWRTYKPSGGHEAQDNERMPQQSQQANTKKRGLEIESDDISGDRLARAKQMEQWGARTIKRWWRIHKSKRNHAPDDGVAPQQASNKRLKLESDDISTDAQDISSITPFEIQETQDDGEMLRQASTKKRNFESGHILRGRLAYFSIDSSGDEGLIRIQ